MISPVTRRPEPCGHLMLIKMLSSSPSSQVVLMSGRLSSRTVKHPSGIHVTGCQISDQSCRCPRVLQHTSSLYSCPMHSSQFYRESTTVWSTTSCRNAICRPTKLKRWSAHSGEDTVDILVRNQRSCWHTSTSCTNSSVQLTILITRIVRCWWETTEMFSTRRSNTYSTGCSRTHKEWSCTRKCLGDPKRDGKEISYWQGIDLWEPPLHWRRAFYTCTTLFIHVQRKWVCTLCMSGSVSGTGPGIHERYRNLGKYQTCSTHSCGWWISWLMWVLSQICFHPDLLFLFLCVGGHVHRPIASPVPSEV